MRGREKTIRRSLEMADVEVKENDTDDDVCGGCDGMTCGEACDGKRSTRDRIQGT